MFVELYVDDMQRSDLGWILGKHPERQFGRDVKRGRRVTGTWISPEDVHEHPWVNETTEWAGYKVIVENDPLIFLDAMKADNKSNYVSCELCGVCPHNLMPFKVVPLKSTFTGNFSSEASRSADKLKLACVVGPFPGDTDRLARIVSMARDHFDLMAQREPRPHLSRSLRFDAAHLMTIDEFLQRVYILCWIMTKRFASARVPKQWDMLEAMSKNWVHRASARVQSIVGYGGGQPSKSQWRQWQAEAAAVTAAEAAAVTARDQDPVGEGGDEVTGGGAGKEDVTCSDKATGEGNECNAKAVVCKDDHDDGGDDDVVDDDESLVDESLAAATTFAGDTQAITAATAKSSRHGVHDSHAEEAGLQVSSGLSLHETRHQLIVAWLKALPLSSTDPVSIVDWGCAQGSLTVSMAEALPHASFTCVDADPWLERQRALRRLSNVTTVLSNLILPNPSVDAVRGADVVVCTEVIEHMEHDERMKLMKTITHYLRPKYVCITTPNVEWNQFIPNLQPGDFRHHDHKVEYVREQWEHEVLHRLDRAGYDVTELELCPGDAMQPSFVCVAVRTERAQAVENDFVQQIRLEYEHLHGEVWLPRNQLRVKKRDLKAAMLSYGYIQCSERMFYAAPTIAPVEFDDAYPGFLEHPHAAFDYFRNAGVDEVCAEFKYMGSRATLLAIRRDLVHSDEVALQVLSRNGYPFFGRRYGENDLYQQLLVDTQAALRGNNLDWMILDGEMMPWALKGGSGLIEDGFISPGECAVEFRRYALGAEHALTKAAEDFVTALRHHASEDGPKEFRVFQVLAAGAHVVPRKPRTAKGGRRRRGDRDTDADATPPAVKAMSVQRVFATRPATFMGEYAPAAERFALIERLCSNAEALAVAEHRMLRLNDAAALDAAVVEWEAYCAAGGEGWVVKPARSLVCFTSVGRPVNPMIKVRGKDYLRIIYGIDMYDSAYFGRITKRRIGPKRKLSRRQFECADHALKCWLNGHRRERLRYLAAFYAVDYQVVNATL